MFRQAEQEAVLGKTSNY